MNEERFWSMIDAAWASAPELRDFQGEVLKTVDSEEAKEDLEEIEEGYSYLQQFVDNLRTQLDELPQNELLEFDRILERKLYDIDREEVHEYTDGSDDGFLYCRGFIVGMGKKYYDSVNREPSSAMYDWECEELTYLPFHIYHEKFGDPPRSNISRETGSNPDGWD